MADFVGASGGIIEVGVEGLDKIMADLSPQHLSAGLAVGLSKVGNLVGREAKTFIRPHHFTGHYEQMIHATVTGEGFNTRVTVGVSVPQVPEARPLEYGWKSTGGKQPPTDAIARWLARKPDIAGSVTPNAYRNSQGFRRTRGTLSQVSSESAVKGLAFVIARSIARKGYTSAPDGIHAWSKAWAIVAPQAGAIIRRSLLWRGHTAGD